VVTVVPEETPLPSVDGIVRLGILGGTFDPIHNGHLALADYAATELALDQVWFIPAADPPHKQGRLLADAHIRWDMVRASMSSHAPRFVPVDLELRRAGFSYTVDTLAGIAQHVGTGVSLHWIIGRDNVALLPTWHRAEDICSLATIVAGGRPGKTIPPDLPDWFLNRLVILDGPDIAVSSTDIRDCAARGLIREDLIPRSVAKSILEHQLYGYSDPSTE
jgi:nicotinate-nucleotide adenylyltransferase